MMVGGNGSHPAALHTQVVQLDPVPNGGGGGQHGKGSNGGIAAIEVPFCSANK